MTLGDITEWINKSFIPTDDTMERHRMDSIVYLFLKENMTVLPKNAIVKNIARCLSHVGFICEDDSVEDQYKIYYIDTVKSPLFQKIRREVFNELHLPVH